jgi:hypothetical protein
LWTIILNEINNISSFPKKRSDIDPAIEKYFVSTRMHESIIKEVKSETVPLVAMSVGNASPGHGKDAE